LASELETLFKLQEIDAELLVKHREVETFEHSLSERRLEMDGCSARIDGLAARRKELVNLRALADRRVSDNQEQLKERRQRLTRVRNERELRAGEGEVNSLREEIDTQEEQLLELMNQVEEIERQLGDLRKEYSELEDAAQRQVEQDQARIDELKKELDAERASRDTVAAELGGSMRSRYEQVLARRGGRAVVRVNGGSCAGCHMQIPPQTVIEILKSGAVRTCPSCQRILYVAEQQPSA